MATIAELERLQNVTAETEEQIRHNAMIKERYRRLQNAEAEQFMEETYQENANFTVRASVLAPERPASTITDAPVFEQTPQVTEFVREYSNSPVFTTEKFNAVQEVVPVAQENIVEMPTQAPVQAVAVEQETQYSLSRLAKTVMAAFAAVVVLMFTLICVNTQIIQRKTMELNALETQQSELIEEYSELQSRIAQARSEETIRAYVQGMN